MAFNGAPLAVDMFSRYYANYFNERAYIRNRVAGQSFFGRTATGSNTVFSPNALDIDIDISRGNERTAAVAVRGTAGKFTGTVHQDGQIGQMSTVSRKFLLVEEEFNLGAHQLNARVPGEGPYQGYDDTARIRMLGGDAYQELIRRHTRLFEVFAWQSLLLGVQSAQNLTDTTVNIYDFRRNSANQPTLTHGWGNALGVPLTDIDAACIAQLGTGKLVPNGLVLGGDSMRYLLANTQVSTNYGNKLYFDLLQFSNSFQPGPEFADFVAAGLIPYGKLRTPYGFDLTVFTYPFTYSNSSGTQTFYMDKTKALLFSTDARADRFYGPNETLPMTQTEMQSIMERFGFNPMSPPMPPNISGVGVVDPAMFYVDAYQTVDRKSITMRVQSAPIFSPTMTDAFGAFTPGVTS